MDTLTVSVVLLWLGWALLPGSPLVWTAALLAVGVQHQPSGSFCALVGVANSWSSCSKVGGEALSISSS